MSAFPITPALLAAEVKAIRAKTRDARVIGVHVPGLWPGPAAVDAGPERIDVVVCNTVLGVRAQLAHRTASAAPVVILTDRSEAELGADVLARLARRRIVHVDRFRLLLELFRAHRVDPRVARHGWLADELIALAPAEGYPAVASGYLDADTAWGELLRRRFRLADARPDAGTLLEWTLEDGQVEELERSAAEVKDGVASWLAGSVGPVGAAIVRSVQSGRGRDAVAIGLVCRVLHAEGGKLDVELGEARVRLEPLVGGQALSADVGRGWAEAAERLVRSVAAKQDWRAANPLLVRAQDLLRELRAEPHAWRSPLLETGFDQRCLAYAGRLESALEGAAPDLGDLERAAASVREHDFARVRPDRTRAMEMSLRLLRRLRESRAPASLPESFAQAASSYAKDGAVADWARYVLLDGDPLVPVARAYGALLARTTADREHENRRFGELLAGWATSGSKSPGVVPVEAVLEDVVAGIGKASPVLLLVVDGMSFAVFHQLLSDLGHESWVELGQESVRGRTLAVAAFPTVTEVSRTSLLSGTLRRGAAGEEREGFARHRALLSVSRPGLAPVLFHKAMLPDLGGSGLSGEVRDEVMRAARRVVGVVINAVDDFLLKGDQVHPRWDIEYVRPLRWLLDAARAAGRVVVVTSDHGHVLERDLEHRTYPAGGERWRPADTDPRDGEVVIGGPRVVAPVAGPIIAPWSERIRYGMKKNGYHGGVSPQEALVPLAVFTAAEDEVPGWVEIAAEVPSWWEPAEPPERRPAVPRQLRPGRRRETAHPSLFGEAPSRPVPVPDWLAGLFASPAYREQKRLVERMALADERVLKLLVALDVRGGKMTRPALARALDMPLLRLGGFLTAARRLLCVDGYPVLGVDEDSDSVELNRSLLDTQFGLRVER